MSFTAHGKRTLSAMTTVIVLALVFFCGQAQGALKDFNGDGKADILLHHADTGEMYVWLMNGTQLASWGSPATVSDLDWQVKGLGDFDGDGKADIIWRHETGGNTYVWLMDGTQIKFHQGTTYSITDTDWQIKGVGDFDGDSKADIIWHHATYGFVCIWLMDGTEIKDYEIFITIPDVDWQIKRVSDFDGDGKADILWRHASQGSTYIWLMDGISIKYHQGTQYNITDMDWQIRGVGDFDGDGQGDVIWHHATEGHACLWFIDGGEIIDYDIFLTAVDLNWQIMDTADYNGDGKADILWLDNDDSELYISLMNGSTVALGGSPGALPDPEYLIVCGGNSDLQETCDKDESVDPSCPTTSGSNTFLWKPESDRNGNLVVLLPNKYRCNVESCGVYSDAEGKNLIELGEFTTDEHNGDRVHYYFSQPGGNYGTNIYCVAFLLNSCDPVSYFIEDGSQRTEYDE